MKKYIKYGAIVLGIGLLAYLVTRKKGGNVTSPEEAMIHSMISNIKANTEWYSDVQARATEHGETIEGRLRKEAIYLLKNQGQLPSDFVGYCGIIY